MVPLPGAAWREPAVYTGRMNTTILWHDRETLGAERCTLTSLESGFQFRRYAVISSCFSPVIAKRSAFTRFTGFSPGSPKKLPVRAV